MSTAQGHFQSSTPHGGIWHSLNRLLITLILLIVAALGALRFSPVLSERRALQTRLSELTAEVEQERQLLARNLRDEKLLKVDPEFAAIFARDRLDLMAEGETIYRFSPPRVEQANMHLNR